MNFRINSKIFLIFGGFFTACFDIGYGRNGQNCCKCFDYCTYDDNMQKIGNKAVKGDKCKKGAVQKLTYKDG